MLSLRLGVDCTSMSVENITAETVPDVMFRAWIKRYGCPVEAHSDQGRQYESTLFLVLSYVACYR